MMGALLMVIGNVAIALSWPVDGVAGMALALGGIALLWIGYAMFRRSRGGVR